MKRVFTFSALIPRRACAIFILIISSLSLYADEFVVNKIHYEKLTLNTVSVISSNYSNVKNVTIPDNVVYDGISYNVTSIGISAFEGRRNLTSVTIPNSVTSIGDNAFSGCSGLTSVIIPNSVQSIGSYAFQFCSGLTSVIIPNSVQSIGSYAFSGCSGLTSVLIGNSVTTIGGRAFSGCRNLTSVTIPNSVQSIGSYAFSHCSGLTSVLIGNGVTEIGDYAFEYCNVTDVHITDLAAWCKIQFSYANGITTNIHHLYIDNNEIKDLVIPNNVEVICGGAFSNCGGLTSVTIPNSVQSIEAGAFEGCI